MSLEFWVWDFDFGVWDFEFWSLGIRVWVFCMGLNFEGWGLQSWCLGFWVCDLEYGDCGLEICSLVLWLLVVGILSYRFGISSLKFCFGILEFGLSG